MLWSVEILGTRVLPSSVKSSPLRLPVPYKGLPVNFEKFGACLNSNACKPFVSDCSGDVTTEAHEDAKALMTQAGAHPITWMNASGQWSPDYTSKERALMIPIYTKYGGGGTNFLTDYVLDQIAAGVVPQPNFKSAQAASR
jgi:hypothetical protein